MPIQPRIEKHPELTTAPLRLAPLKLLPFGGTARCRANRLIKTQDKNHHNPRHIRMTAGRVVVRVMALLMLKLIASIAIFHFTWLAQASIIRLHVAAGARGRHR